MRPPIAPRLGVPFRDAHPPEFRSERSEHPFHLLAMRRIPLGIHVRCVTYKRDPLTRLDE
jgi:hypothetical protein